jgi:solute carrier family 12 (sodium/potassium/chloride transporter), member 2
MSEQEQGGDDTRRYGTLEGVFVPTLLTILGVILFLRTGWVVGNAGLLGGVGIIVSAFVITGFTALSLASISTNVAPEAGGAYALVARSFGVEAGGAVGVSLYLSQSLVIVLYTFGFRDGWLTIFPGHPPLLVDVVMVTALIVVALVGTKAAFRVQFLILGTVVVALVTLAIAAVTDPLDQSPPLLGTFPGAPEDGFPGTDLWAVFAVFFPATTGIMAGLNMSGELRDPRRSIMRGTLGAVGVSALIYLAVALYLLYAVPIEELVSDYFVMVERSAWGPAVLAGLLTATFSSALASLVGAPRILHALADHGLTPLASRLARRNGAGEPRQALVVTIVVVAAGVLLRDLNAIAPLITMFFLLTYGAINVAVLAETVVDLPSYRPTFRVPWPVPLVGAVGCLGAMLVIDVWFTVIALGAVGGVLLWLARREMERPVTDIRSAMLLALGQWATRTAKGVTASDDAEDAAERTWSPRLLVPLGDLDDVQRARRWVPEMAVASVPARLVTVRAGGISEELRAATDDLRDHLEASGVDTSLTTEEIGEADRGPAVALFSAGDDDDPQAANVVVAGFPEQPERDHATRLLLRAAFDVNIGVVLVPPRPPPLGDTRPDIALWVRAQAPQWPLERHLPHSDLALLMTYRLSQTWDARIRLVTAIRNGDDAGRAEEYLGEVAERARLPAPEILVVEHPFADALDHVGPVNLHVLALSTQVDFDWLREVRERLEAPCLFVRDSGVENAFA